jgi:hypothetical protein
LNISSSLTSEPEALPPTAVDTAVFSKRVLIGLVGLMVLTVGSLGMAWLCPDTTLLHFLWVAQAVPVLYLFLAWWGTRSSQLDDGPT